MSNSAAEQNYDGIKAGVWYAVGNIIVKAIPFLSLPIFTRLMTTEDFGIYNTYLSYENILAILLGFGFSQTVKIAKIDFAEAFEKYVSSVIKVVILLGGVFLLVGNLLYGVLMKHMQFFQWLNPLLLNMLAINSVATAIYAIMGAKYVIVGKYRENLFISLLMTAVNVGASLLLCYLFLSRQRALARIAGTMIGALSVAVFVLVSQGRCAPLALFEKANRYAFRYGLPLIPHQLSISLFSQCDKIMIQAIVGNAEAGIYGLAVNIMLVLSVLVSSFDSAWTPWFFENLNKGKYEYIKKTNNLFVLFFIYVYAGFLLLAPDVIHLLSDSSYWPALDVLLPLAVSSYINFIYLFSVGIEYFYKRTEVISLATMSCTGANIVLNYLFIKKWGYVGAAYSTCITKFLLFLVHYVVSHRILAQRMADLGYLLGGLALLILLGFISAAFANRFVIRLSVILMLSLVIFTYFKKKGIINMLLQRFAHS